MSINAMWNANSLVQVLNLSTWVHFLQQKQLYHMYLHIPYSKLNFNLRKNDIRHFVIVIALF